jgi:hypothetical protein
VFVAHVANDPSKEDAIHEHVLLWDPNRFFGYAGAQLLEHALLGDAAPGVLALGVQYHEDGGSDERPPRLNILRQFLALLGLEAVGVAHLDDSKETRQDVGPTPVKRRRRPLSW